ncbi:MAG: glycosyltransferase family 2 protein [Elusimicrobia bacterium]|nr:glycosyltransferase family 2 protein [Candidatus Liberimonas magnetica]
MRLSGCTIVRNGVKYGYPFIESIRSVLPICGEVIVGVGDSQDQTRKMIENINDPKVKIIDTVWDMNNRTGGAVLSQQTNLALEQCKGSWIFYLQADEAVHEDDFQNIIPLLEIIEDNKSIDGLAFKYLHFYGSYFTVQTGRNWYKQEVRVIRNNAGIRSFGDAQGFRKNGQKISAVDCGARIFHYGWARPPEIMLEKIKSFHHFWHDDAWIDKNTCDKKLTDYFSDLGNLAGYSGKHPSVMSGILSHENDIFIKAVKEQYLKCRSLKDIMQDFLKRVTIGQHRNFNLVKI